MTNTAEQTNEDQDIVAMLRDSAADYCSRSLAQGRIRALRGAQPAFDRMRWSEMAELGWTAMMVAESKGGLGMGAAAALALGQELGAVAAPEPVIESAIGATTLLEALGDELHLDAMLDGSTIVVAALTALPGKAASEQFESIELRDGTLRGHISSMPVGRDADAYLLPATIDGAPSWFYVERDASGFAIEALELADGTFDARLDLDRCAGREIARGQIALDGLLKAQALSECASSAYMLGICGSLFKLCTDYVATRHQFGRAIGSFQIIQHRLVDMYLALRLAQAVVNECAIKLDHSNSENAQILASRARYRACETTRLLTREAIQIHGAIGYTDECDVGLFVNRALVLMARYGQANLHTTRINRLRTPESSASSDANALAEPSFEPPNGDWNSIDNAQFRAVVRAWFEENYPRELINPRARLRWHESKDWYAVLYAKGWAAPAWPREHNGMGLEPEKFLIFVEERERLGVARTPDQGIIMVGPLLMQHGSQEQREYYLPKALSGEHIWCQGYSEPNSGSDLASLATSAVRDGDEFVINGQKIWTTLAQDATHMFCLVRTDQAAKPQAGISFVLIDFKSPGITVRPIRNIAGEEEFCEVFFDDVRVPVANLVGELNDGWRIAKALLSFERIFIGSPKQCQLALSRLRVLAQANGLMSDTVFLDRLTHFELDVMDLESLFKEFADIIRRGEVLGADVSLLKIWASDTVIKLSEFMLEAAGSTGGCAGDVEVNGESIEILSHYYNARQTPIYGGSNEIQRNILAKHVLKLPT